MNSPMVIITAPNITVQRMPYFSATRPIRMPPTAEPNQASEAASEGTERCPPISAAIDFSPTEVIHGAPKESPSRSRAMLATTQEVRVSMLDVVNPIPGGLTMAGADHLNCYAYV